MNEASSTQNENILSQSFNIKATKIMSSETSGIQLKGPRSTPSPSPPLYELNTNIANVLVNQHQNFVQSAGIIDLTTISPNPLFNTNDSGIIDLVSSNSKSNSNGRNLFQNSNPFSPTGTYHLENSLNISIINPTESSSSFLLKVENSNTSIDEINNDENERILQQQKEEEESLKLAWELSQQGIIKLYYLLIQQTLLCLFIISFFYLLNLRIRVRRSL